MANTVPPVPPNNDYNSPIWKEWFRKLREAVVNPGNISWGAINFAGSKLSDIADRPHNVLQTIQGGATGQYYHLSQDQYNSLSAVRTVTTNTTVLASDSVILADDTSGNITVTLPSALNGKRVTVKKVSTSGNTISLGTVDGVAFSLTIPQEYATILITTTANYRIG